MSVTNIDSIMLKIHDLPVDAQKEVADFVEFLHHKKKKRKRKIDKKRLLNVSVWSEEDVKIFDDIREDMNQWKINEF